MDIITLSLAKKYANSLKSGIKSITYEDNDLIFLLEDNSQFRIPVPEMQKEQIDSAVAAALEKNIDLSNYYTKNENDNLLDAKENSSNKIQIISSTSTDAQYPSAKAVYDYITSLDAREERY